MPCDFEVAGSVRDLVESARQAACKDHRDSFETKKERDLIATVYLDRAREKLRDET